MTKSEKLLKHLEENGKDGTWRDLTKRFGDKGVGDDWARTVARMNGFNSVQGEFTVKKKVEYTKMANVSHRHMKENKELVRRIIDLEKDLGLKEAVDAHKVKQIDIPAPKGKNTSQATAIVQWSDWHVDEVVDNKTVNGLNEYGKETAKRRSLKLFENTIKLTETQRSSIVIEDLVLHLGGDAIGAYIHPELVQTNWCSPLEGILYAKELIAAGINYILKYGKFKNIVVVCSRGNHPRLTPKMQFSNDHSMNLEMFLYQSLQDIFSAVKNIRFQLDQSELSYVTVYGKTLRFFHGHQIRSMGGIGGLTIPLYKQIHRWNDNIKADYNFMCDKHCYSTPTPDCQVNGSMKGFDAFAVSHGFKFQPPIQSFTLLDSKRGITIKAPIFCE